MQGPSRGHAFGMRACLVSRGIGKGTAPAASAINQDLSYYHVPIIDARHVHIRAKPAQAEPSNPRIQRTILTGYDALQSYFEKAHKKTNRSRSYFLGRTGRSF